MTNNTIAKLTYPCEIPCPICGHAFVHFRTFPGTVLTGSGRYANRSVGVRLDLEGECGHRFFLELCELPGSGGSRVLTAIGY